MVFRLVLSKGQTCSLVAVGANESPTMQQSLTTFIAYRLQFCEPQGKQGNRTKIGVMQLHASPVPLVIVA